MIKIKAACLYLTIAVLSADAAQQHETFCKQGWEKLSGGCYKFGTETVTWPEAVSLCRAIGGHLLEINTQEENDLIVAQLRGRNFGSVWLGSTDMFNEGTWLWLSNDESIATIANFSPGQPDNDDEKEHCLELRIAYEYQWNDYQCLSKSKFICETRPLPNNSYCHDGVL